MHEPKLILDQADDGSTVAAFENRPETIACAPVRAEAIARARNRLALAEAAFRLKIPRG